MVLYDMLESKWDEKQVLPKTDKNWRWVDRVNWGGWICVEYYELLSYLNSKMILWNLDELVSWLLCAIFRALSVTSALLPLVEPLGTAAYFFHFLFFFPWVQLLEFRIALNKIDQTDNLTTIISSMAHGPSFKGIFTIYPNGLFFSCLQCVWRNLTNKVLAISCCWFFWFNHISKSVFQFFELCKLLIVVKWSFW